MHPYVSKSHTNTFNMRLLECLVYILISHKFKINLHHLNITDINFYVKKNILKFFSNVKNLLNNFIIICFLHIFITNTQ